MRSSPDHRRALTAFVHPALSEALGYLPGRARSGSERAERSIFPYRMAGFEHAWGGYLWVIGGPTALCRERRPGVADRRSPEPIRSSSICRLGRERDEPSPSASETAWVGTYGGRTAGNSPADSRLEAIRARSVETEKEGVEKQRCRLCGRTPMASIAVGDGAVWVADLLRRRATSFEDRSHNAAGRSSASRSLLQSWPTPSR